MRQQVFPRLINPPFSDPGLYVDTGGRRGALLFDIGECCALPGADLDRIAHLFVSHTHMDHVMGLDRLVRRLLGKPVTLRVYGPEGIIGHVRRRLSAYTWNLTGGQCAAPVIVVTEIGTDYHLRQRLDCRNGFLPDLAPVQSPSASVIMDDGLWQVAAEILDHRTPCLGFRMAARERLNVDSKALDRFGFTPGRWVAELKSLAARGPISAEIRVTATRRAGAPQPESAADLARRLIRRRPGQTFAYVTDAAYSTGNIDKILTLARNADHLFIEAPFLSIHADHAAAKRHLTARQAGSLAARAGARDFTLFHFSPRYRGCENQLETEARRAFEESDPMGGIGFPAP